MKRKYWFLHIPTGLRELKEFNEVILYHGKAIDPTHKNCLEVINAWNAANPGTYQYWLPLDQTY